MKYFSSLKRLPYRKIFQHRSLNIIFVLLLIAIPVLIYLIFKPNQALSSSVTFITKWGIAGTGDGQFNNPFNIAITPLGNVYVSDYLNNRVQEFDSSGNYITQWGSPGTGNGQFQSPSGIAFDSDGNVYVVDRENYRVQKFSSSGTYILQWGILGTGHGQFNLPNGITIDVNNNIYVSDSENYRIQKFDTLGNYITQWGSLGTGDGQFDHSTGIAVDRWNNVYVVDENSNRVQKFDSFGNYITQWGSLGTGDGQFDSPYGIAVDANGNVYIVDTVNDRIERFDSVGNFALTWGTTGSGNSQFSGPVGIAVDSSGSIYVADTLNNRIQEFTVSFDLGSYLSTADTNTYRGSSNVNSLIKIGDTVYLGGEFGMQAINSTDGSQMSWDPAIPNDPNTGTVPEVYSLAYSANTNTLYAGASNGILAFDLSTSAGTLISWTPGVLQGASNGKVNALAIQGATLYAGGQFDSIDSQPRVNLASFDISTPTGVLTGFTADTNPGSEILTMKTINGNVYIGGNFSSIGGTSQAILAELDTNLSSISSTFAPGLDQTNSPYIKALETYNGFVYAGGFFNRINGTAFTNLARVDQTTGAPDNSWVPAPTTNVYALALKDTYLYAGEANQTLGGETVSGGGAIAYNLQTGNLSDWNSGDDQAVHAIIAENNALYVGLIENAAIGSTFGKTTDLVRNLFKIPEAYADIGGLGGTIYLAQFNLPVTTPTPTLLPTSTPTPTVTPTPGPTSTPTPTGSSVSAPVCSDTKPASPSNVTATASSSATQITLSWTAAADPVTDYSITYSDNSTSQKWGVVSTGKVTSYPISSLNSGITYYFWVNAVNGCMPGDPIGPASLTSGPVSSSSGTTTGSVANALASAASGSSVLNSAGVSPLPPTGPSDLIKLGGLGALLTILGLTLLLAL